jgi:hypothetical protein
MARAPAWLVSVASLALLACAVGGCSSAPTSVPAPAHATPPTVPQAQLLVWATGGEGTLPTTYGVANDGTVVSRTPGIRIWAAGTEWTSDVTVETVPTSPCEGHAAATVEPGRGVRVRLVPADPSRAPLELVSPASEEAAEIEQSARLLASVGPYVFVEDWTYAFTCGAHGNTGVGFTVWNVEEGRPVDLLADLPDREHLLAEGKRIIDTKPDAADFSRPEDPPTITELLPRIGSRGQIRATVLVTVPSCYACTEGGWSSYTMSTEVPTQLPWRLRDLGQPPCALGTFVAAHPDLTIGGYSVAR